MTTTTAPEPVLRRHRAVLLFGLASLLALAFAAVAVGVAVSRRPVSTSEGPAPTLAVFTRALPAAAQLDLPRLGGGRFELSALGKHPLVVNFFASWCTACQEELAAVARVARDGGVPFFGVDTNETSFGRARAMLQKAGADYPVGIGGTAAASKYRTHGLPTTAFVDARGRIAAIAFGAVTPAQLSSWVTELKEGRRLVP